MLEHSAAKLNRVNCSGGQGVQHSSGTLCLHCVAEGRGAIARGWGERGGRRQGKEIISQRHSLQGGSVCAFERTAE
ncbi:hypothetical protein PBY51_010004 [Eleginops maclovinus]|uniref:Uncharacterized protein n=1 Tax=Eleginops maclovinus TaxID=56733 RepID=A0AAN7XS53_ELEMC|nr:hypothetical protein PBY51_010004 [Eleginops maclovinus]